ncbi:MAG: hypothetical protein DU429_07990 [Candidatus Tokpelaia sp.]|nr:MAG: hypothetical protein DU429_07990 [Candidatus Tokpelaia sp.]KAA6206081.1 MAG: hypothetical protein DU430_02275 [Candidatus Tokpelaia sp.]KAA6405640.1 hypothetical protein DPQ22_03780 [Candidatus Tokpelaia sp.]
MLPGEPAAEEDPQLSEQRYRAVKQNAGGRYLFAVFVLRERADSLKIRPKVPVTGTKRGDKI